MIPNALIKLTNLTYLDISYNKIEDLPIELGLMKSLITLKIIGNKIEKLPTTLCQLTNLKEIEFEWFKFIFLNLLSELIISHIILPQSPLEKLL